MAGDRQWLEKVPMLWKAKINNITTIWSALTRVSRRWWYKTSAGLPSSCSDEKLTICRAKKWLKKDHRGEKWPNFQRHHRWNHDEKLYRLVVLLQTWQSTILTKFLTTASASLGCNICDDDDKVLLLTASFRCASFGDDDTRALLPHYATLRSTERKPHVKRPSDRSYYTNKS